MSPRKRRFETLEDRRLLSVLAGAPASPSSVPSSAAEIAPSAPPVAMSSADSTSNDSTSSSESDSTDNPAEYANAAPATTGAATNNAPSASASPSYSYAAPAYDNSYASNDNYASNYATSTPYYTKSPASTSPSNPSTSVQTTSTVPTLQSVSNLSQSTTTDASFAVLLPNAGQAPAAASSPPAARSPSNESLRVELEAPASIAEPVALPTTDGAETLMAPVAQSDSLSGWDRLSARTAAAAEWFARAEPLLPAAEAGARSLLVGSAGAPFATLEDGIDAVFERFDRLGDLADHAQVSRIGQWLILAGGACAAFEYARARYREAGAWQATNAWPILCEPRLRRRWFGRRKAGR